MSLLQHAWFGAQLFCDWLPVRGLAIGGLWLARISVNLSVVGWFIRSSCVPLETSWSSVLAAGSHIKLPESCGVMKAQQGCEAERGRDRENEKPERN